MAFDLVAAPAATEAKEVAPGNPRPQLRSAVRKEKPKPVILEEKTPFRRIENNLAALEASLKSLLPRADATEYGRAMEALRHFERIANIVSVMREGRGSGAM
jgi:hypothetical protein